MVKVSLDSSLFCPEFEFIDRIFRIEYRYIYASGNTIEALYTQNNTLKTQCPNFQNLYTRGEKPRTSIEALSYILLG
jgi:hypothetical protein